MKTQKLRSGYTTGTCAAAAAKAAAVMLLGGRRVQQIHIVTPKGTSVSLPLISTVLTDKKAVCQVKKDAGDDPDVTDQIPIFASVEYGTEKWKERGDCYWQESGIMRESETMQESETMRAPLCLAAGEGIGIVTKPGLPCPVGKPAINPVPRQMIFEAVDQVREEYEITESLLITIWIPEGRRLAEKTFNPKLGIEGGISVLGTTGIVEPMSEAALTATIRLELHMKAVAGQKEIILTPGNYGETFIKEQLGLSLDQAVQCSNFLADTMVMAAEEGIGRILFAGHIGKLIKAAGGVRNTHSRYGDRRMEILWEFTEPKLPESVDLHMIKEKILQSNTTEEAVSILAQLGILTEVMSEAAEAVKMHMEQWSGNRVKVEVVTFSTGYGILGVSENAKALIEEFSLAEE